MSSLHAKGRRSNGATPKKGTPGKKELVQAKVDERNKRPKVELEMRPLEPLSDSESDLDASIEKIVQVKEKVVKPRKALPVDAREKEIESLLFGGSSFLGDTSSDSASSEKEDDDEDQEEGVESESEEPVEHVLGLAAHEKQKKLKEEREPPKKKKKLAEEETLAAWTDDEDAEEHVNIVRSARSRKLRREVEETSVTGDVFQERLRAQHGKGQKSGTPKWAQLPSEEDSPQDPTLDMLKSTSRLVGTKNIGLLEPDRIRIGTMTDANKSGVSKAVVQVIRWHPNGSILMTAGFDKTIRLFDIDGLKNTRLQSAHFNDLPISSAQFSHSGNEIYLAGLHHSFYVYDILSAKIDRVDRIMGTNEEEFKMMLCGPHADSYIVFLGGKGQIHVVSPKTKKWVTTMKMNGSVKVAVFDKEGRLWTAGGRGEVYIWDMKSFTCLRRFSDEGGGRITAMSMSPTGEFFATGQDSGVVNVYNISDPESSFHKSSNPTPTKSILNLTTKITNIEFNHDGQILAIASSTLRNQMRLIHVPTFRVFQNWPTEKTPIGRVSALSFSPEGNWLAVGNVRGACKLFKLHHYHPSSRN